MLRLYNTLNRKIEDFKPLNSSQVTMYSCGPTVYDYQHIGHMRRYVGDDILVRILEMNGYKVDHVMNLTDVGHLVSDNDEGEDKMEKGAKKFGMSVWKIAEKFTQQFFDSTDALNIKRPNKVLKATDHIKEQIVLIETLEKKGFTYKIADGIYFDSSKLSDYGKLTGQKAEELKAGARVEMVEGKKHPTDFALWKFSPQNEKRQMEWESPWGVGFPGWHIECSAMSLKALTDFTFDTFDKLSVDGKKNYTIDIHTGGIDHIPVHHTNEIAQSEAATGKQFVRFWVHHNFLQVEGEKMSKSLGNFYTVQDVMEKGYDPMALRYLYLQTHYRQEMNFTWDSLKSAETAVKKLYDKARIVFSEYRDFDWKSDREPSEEIKNAWNQFVEAVNDDMNIPKALGVLHEGLSNVRDDHDEMYLLQRADEILGLEFEKKAKEEIKLPEKIASLIERRKQYRAEKNYAKSDELRDEILGLGYEVLDEDNGETRVKKVH